VYPMSAAQPGPIRLFFRFIWQAINFTNHLLFNILMLLVLASIVAIIVLGVSAKSFAPLANNTALILNLDGQLVEQRSADTFSAALAEAQGERREIQLRDVLGALEAAKSDPKITHVVLHTEGLNVSGMAAIRELAQALQAFKTSKKPIYAFANSYEQKQYLLAAQADKVFMDPEGAFLPEGLGRYRLFYREALQDKLGLDVYLFRVGEFKSAAEPYILDAASAESKEADLYWMNDIWQRYLVQVGKARHIDPLQISAAIHAMPARLAAVNGDMAQWALQEKWVDGLKTSYEMEQFLVQQGVAEDMDQHSFRGIDFMTYLARVQSRKSQSNPQNTVAVVVAQGEITDGEQPPGTIGGESTSALIRMAREDEHVKALVLRIDSPGGGVFPSEQIRREVALTKAAGKPVVVSMGNVAASGGYWIAMDADKIYADASTITGSIGIFGLMVRAPRALEKIGVHSDGVSTTPWGGAFDISRPMDASTKQVIQSVIDHGYAQFVGKVSKARQQSYAQIDANARGRVWSGAQAKDKGLVDALGGLSDAVAEAAARAKLDKDAVNVSYIENPLSPFEQFLSSLARNSATQGVVRAWAPALSFMHQTKVENRLGQDLLWLNRKGSQPINAVAHCFCVF
jgi:protease-4